MMLLNAFSKRARAKSFHLSGHAFIQQLRLPHVQSTVIGPEDAKLNRTVKILSFHWNLDFSQVDKHMSAGDKDYKIKASRLRDAI